MGKTVQINDHTSFVFDDGRLVAIDEAEEIEISKDEQRKVLRQLAEDQAWQLVPEFVRENDAVMFNTTVQFALDQVKEWLRIKISNESEWNKKNPWKLLMEGMDKSALLERLLSGKGAFSTLPPDSYGHAWYDLVESGEDICIDVFFGWKNWNLKGTHYDKVRIDDEDWEVIEEISKGEFYIVCWPKDKDTLYSLSRLTEEDVGRLLHPRLRRLSDGKDAYSWKLKRMDKVEEDDN